MSKSLGLIPRLLCISFWYCDNMDIEKVIGKCVKNCHCVVLTIKSEPYNILLYISVENEAEFCKLLEQHIED